MKLVKSVFREFNQEFVFDPAESLVKQFNAVVARLTDDEAEVINMLAEDIVAIRLKQDNTFTEGSETGAMYHDRRRWDSGIVEKGDHHGVS